MERTELPMGFAMALARNEAAMKTFEALSEAEKNALVQQTHGIQSKQEMRRFVASLAETTGGQML